MIRKLVTIACGMAAGLALAAPAQAQDRTTAGTPQQFQRLMACRAMSDAQQRLSCFDRETAAMAQAVESRDLVMVDRDKARAARRSLFGFSVPDFAGLLGRGGDDEVKQVEGLVENANENRDGGWTVRLQDGSVWTQIDDTVVPLTPKRGEKVVIRRAAFGSFFMKVGRQPGFRAKRIG
jgi:hypothetical protein